MKELLADIIIKNGKVLTVNRNDDIAEAVAIRGDRILAVGSNADVEEYCGGSTRIIDAGGKTVLPGFIDAHIHVGMFGLLDHGVINVAYPKVHCIADIQKLIREDAAKKKPGEWISMMGYEPLLFPEKRHPTIQELDEIAPDNPVHCMHGGGHICMYNHKALEYLGVYGPEDASKYPPGEVEVVDGRLTGMVYGHTHFWLRGQVTYTEAQQK